MNSSILNSYKSLASLTTITYLLTMAMTPPSSATALRQYKNVNPKQFNECIKPPSSNGSEQGWADYHGENKGKVELKVRNQPMISDGTVAATLNYQFEPSEGVLTLEIKEKTKFMFGMIEASNEQIWEGFDGLVTHCQKKN